MKSIKKELKTERLQFIDEYCDHNGKQFQKMIVDGKVVCPRCETESLNQTFEKKVNEELREREALSKYQVLEKHSLLLDIGLWDAKLSNYETLCDETKRNFAQVLDLVQRITEGEKMSVWFSGHTGVGKSHLAMAMLKTLNEFGEKDKSCLFINTNMLMDAIRDSFAYKDVKTTQSYMTNLLTSVDYLVLDDIGSEVGAIQTRKMASDFVTRVMYTISTGRQDKVTIYTTNLSEKALRDVYDGKTLSRLTKNARSIVFEITTDKRAGILNF